MSRRPPIWRFEVRLLAGLLLSLAPALWPTAVRACATCQLGDPTLTTFGLGQPFAQRLRVGLRYEMNGSEFGTGANAFDKRHHEVGLLAAYTPTTWLTLDADLPMVHSQVSRANGSLITTTQVGDAEVGARMQLWKRRARGRNQHLWTNTRLKLPTSPKLTTAQGGTRPLEEQAGTGAFVPQLGLGYSHLGGPVGGFLTARADLPTQGFGRSRPSRGAFVTLALQWQPLAALGLRVSWDQAYQGHGRELDGSRDPDSGGLLWNASATLLWAPVMDLVISVGAQVPVWQRLNGAHQERPVAVASLLYDLGGKG